MMDVERAFPEGELRRVLSKSDASWLLEYTRRIRPLPGTEEWRLATMVMRYAMMLQSLRALRQDVMTPGRAGPPDG